MNVRQAKKQAKEHYHNATIIAKNNKFFIMASGVSIGETNTRNGAWLNALRYIKTFHYKKD